MRPEIQRAERPDIQRVEQPRPPDRLDGPIWPPVPTWGNDAQALRGENTRLRRENADLRRENADLRRRLRRGCM